MDLNDLKSKAKEALRSTDLDEKVGAAAKQMKGKVQDVLDKTDLDEKIRAGADKLMEKAYNDIVNGTFNGSIVEGGMADGVVGLVYGSETFNPSVPAELQAELNDMIAKITSGEMEIVGNPADLKQ